MKVAQMSRPSPAGRKVINGPHPARAVPSDDPDDALPESSVTGTATGRVDNGAPSDENGSAAWRVGQLAADHPCASIPIGPSTDAAGAAGGVVTTIQAENSEVLLPGSVAVAVMNWPGSRVTPRVKVKLAVQVASVVRVKESR